MVSENKASENAWNQSRTTRMKKLKFTNLDELKIKAGLKGGKSKEQTDGLDKIIGLSEAYPSYIPTSVYPPYDYETITYPEPNWGDKTQIPYAKEQFNPDDHRGKFCAHVTAIYKGVELTGILFVKQCGHWKILEYNGNKRAGGTSGSFEAECKKGTLQITVLHVLFDADKPIVQPASEGFGELDILDIIGETGLEIS